MSSSPAKDDQVYTVYPQSPRNWLEELHTSEMTGDHLSVTGSDSMKFLEDETRRIELEIANLMRAVQTMSPSNAVTSLRIEGLVYAIADFYERMTWENWTRTLGACPLMQHAKVIPISYAIMQYYLYHGMLQLRPNDYLPNAVVVVLHCDEMSVDCMPYSLQAVSTEYAEIRELPTTFISEVCGYVSFPVLLRVVMGYLLYNPMHAVGR